MKSNGKKKTNRGATASSSSHPVEVKLLDLITSDKNQIRAKFDAATAERYAAAMRAGTEFPPITVAQINGAPVLVDGFHRVAAAREVGLQKLPAIVVEAKPNEFRWIAAEANLKHGLPLKRSEVRNVFKAYVKAGRCYHDGGAVKSSREIASDLLGLRTHQTFLTWMKEDFPKVWREMVRNEEPRHDGGEPDIVHQDERMRMMVLDHLNQAKAAMRAIRDPDMRGQMIAEAEELINAMRAQGPWNAYDLEF